MTYHLPMPLPPSIDRPTLPELFTVKETAEYLHLHPDTVIKLLRTGRIRGAKVMGKWVVRAEDLLHLSENSSGIALQEGAA
jgi:excisionase family DNA binding protein